MPNLILWRSRMSIATRFMPRSKKRDRPELADRPVIIGGGARSVVLACCYVARLYGVRSAMPMFKALAACPDAVVIRPDMAKYSAVGREVRAEMRQLTPLVEPVSIDEAFLHLGGTKALHGSCPAQLLAGLAKRVETAYGITVSIGLSNNKFLAKIASDLDKPRGFAVLSHNEASAFLAGKPVSSAHSGPQARDRRSRAACSSGPRRRPPRGSRACSGAHDLGRDHLGAERVRCECPHPRIVATL